jgi:rod shape-determining protein MreB
MICVPTGITSTERRAVIEATKGAGAGQVYLIKEPLAAAIGADIPVGEPVGNMVVDIGGGTTEVAVISLGGIVTDGSIRVGGDKFESAILEYIRKKSNIAIGEGTAENIKIKIGSAIDDKKDKTINIRGRNLKSGLPEIITIGSREITDSIQEELEEIIKVIKAVLEKTPPELAADILDHGIVLTGGGALLKGLNQLITNKTGVPCFVSDYPLLSVAKGTGMVLDNLEKYKKALD